MRRFIQQVLIMLLIGFCYTALAQGILKFNAQITGLKNAELKNALARLQIRQKPVKDHLTPNIIQKLFKHGPREIRKAIEPFGYFKPTITKSLTTKNNIWTATYSVNPGRQLHITTLNINITGSGKNNKQLQKLLARLRKKTGKVFTTKLYNKISNALLNRAQENGYLRANFTKNQTIINLQTYTCKINLILNTGPRYYFGSVTFSPSPFAKSFLQRYVTFNYKTPFSYTKLFNLQGTLEGSEYFRSVAATTYQKNRKHIPVHVALKMNKNKAYKIGIGYGTNSGLRATAGFNWRWVNRWGHKINLLARMSQAEHNLAAQYVIPGRHPAKEQYTINGGIYKLTPHNGVSYMQSIGVAYIRNYTRWQQTISLDYQHEHYRLVDGGKYYRAHMLVPTISFSHVTTNRIINVHRGNRFNITVRGTSEKALSTVTFLQTEVQDKMIYTLWKDNRIVLRGHFGYTVAKKAAQLPISKQFYTGGINSIRGFGYNYLGPGKYLAVGGAEYQRRVYKQIYGAVFYDKGNALNNWKDPMVHSYGVGVVWQTQLGALQVYVAKAKDVSSNKHRYRLEFSLGPDL